MAAFLIVGAVGLVVLLLSALFDGVLDAFDFDMDRLESLKVKAAYIAEHESEPPLDEDIPSWACTYCGHKGTRCEGI